ncbi:FeoA family protein [Phycisphaeraceae bacterium D3-23]
MPDVTPPQDAPPAAAGLDELKAGQTAVILQMDEADHAMLIRLKTMGMHPGRAVRVLRQGSRLVVTCGGTRIGLSATVAKHIRVTPTAS